MSFMTLCPFKILKKFKSYTILENGQKMNFKNLKPYFKKGKISRNHIMNDYKSGFDIKTLS